MPCVLCSTGLSKEDEAVVEQASEKVPVFRSANMSVGINVLIELARRATKLFDGEFESKLWRSTITTSWMPPAEPL